MQFDLLTLSGVKYSGDVAEIEIRTSNGKVCILPRHAAFTAMAVSGPLVVHPKSGVDEIFAIFSGVLDVKDNNVRVLADDAEHSEEIVSAEIQAAIDKAMHLKTNAKSKHELEHAQDLLNRQTVRLEVSRLHHRRHTRH